MGAKGSVEAAKINAQNWNSLEVGPGYRHFHKHDGLLWNVNRDTSMRFRDVTRRL